MHIEVKQEELKTNRLLKLFKAEILTLAHDAVTLLNTTLFSGVSPFDVVSLFTALSSISTISSCVKRSFKEMKYKKLTCEIQESKLTIKKV